MTNQALAKESSSMVYVLCSGWLNKRGGFVSTWKRRYFILRNDRYLCYFSQEIGPETSKTEIKRSMLGMIDLSDALAVGDSTGSGNSENAGTVFDIVTLQRTYVCQASSVDGKSQWIEAIRAMITPLPEFPFSKQGFLYKKNKFKWSRHYFAVGKNCIYTFEDELCCRAFQRIALHSGKMFAMAMNKHCQGAIPLMNASIKTTEDGKMDGMLNTFCVVNSGKNRTWLSASSVKEVKRWTDEITLEILTRQTY